jgi:ankyrin repeat protein
MAFDGVMKAIGALQALASALKPKAPPISVNYQNEVGTTVLMQFIAAYAMIKRSSNADATSFFDPLPAQSAQSSLRANADNRMNGHAAIGGMLQKCNLSLLNVEGWDALGLTTCEPTMIGSWLPRRLIELGADVNARRPDGSTPLHAWSANAKITVNDLKLLLEHGAKADSIDTDGLTPLMRLAANPSCTIELLQLLLERGADINFIGPRRVTPLMHSLTSSTPSVRCTYECVMFMLGRGADITLVDQVGDSLVHHLVTRGKSDLLSRLMLEYGLATESIGCLHTENAACMTPMKLATALKAKSTNHEHIEWMLAAAESEWRAGIRPHLNEALSAVIPVKDLARICCEYLDGSGRSWTVKQEDAEMSAAES